MDDNADPKRILLASPPADWKRQPGRPRITWLGTVQQDLKQHHLTLREAADLAQNHPIYIYIYTYLDGSIDVRLLPSQDKQADNWHCHEEGVDESRKVDKHVDIFRDQHYQWQHTLHTVKQLPHLNSYLMTCRAMWCGDDLVVFSSLPEGRLSVGSCLWVPISPARKTYSKNRFGIGQSKKS